MSNSKSVAAAQAAPADTDTLASFTHRGVTVLPPAVPPRMPIAKIRKALKEAAAKHAELVAG